MTSALIIVDFQNDFLLPGAPLEVLDGWRAREPILELACEADFVFLSQDWHPANHISFMNNGGPWPPHCVRNTLGASVDKALVAELAGDGIARTFVIKGDDPKREAYSAFDGHLNISGEGLLRALRQQRVTHISVVGLALDYCVKATAIDAAKLGYNTAVVLEATRPVEYVTGARAVAELVQHGVEVV